MIELLAVIVIIALLAGILTALYKYAWSKGADSAAKVEIAAIEDALLRYQQQTGTNMVTDNSTTGAILLTNLVAQGYLAWTPSRIDTSGLLDLYGTHYRYLCPGLTNTTSFDVWTTNTTGWIGNFLTQ